MWPSSSLLSVLVLVDGRGVVWVVGWDRRVVLLVGMRAAGVRGRVFFAAICFFLRLSRSRIGVFARMGPSSIVGWASPREYVRWMQMTDDPGPRSGHEVFLQSLQPGPLRV